MAETVAELADTAWLTGLEVAGTRAIVEESAIVVESEMAELNTTPTELGEDD